MLSDIKALSTDLRIEAEHYQRKYAVMRNVLIRHTCKKLSELVNKPIQTGHTPSMKDDSFYGGDIKFIKTDNLRDNEIKYPFSHYLSTKGNEEIKRTELQEDDIITTIIGATYDVIARSCIVRKEMLPANINQNIAHIRPDKNKINPEFLNIYLNSKYGKMYLEYLSRQMEQVNLNCEEVGNVMVPMFSKSFQLQIAKLVKEAHDYIHQSKELYEDAEMLLLDNIRLKDLCPNNHPYNIKSLKESFLASGRLDAEYYQTKYDDCVKLIRNYSNGFKKLVNLCEIIDDNFIPEDNKYYRYIELSNIGPQGNVVKCTTGLGKELPSRARRIVHKGDVIVSSVEGSLESCAIITEEYDSALCSTGFYVMRSSELNSETLLVLFKSEYVQMLMKKGCSGTILSAIGKTELENIPLPVIEDRLQRQIASKLQESFSLKAESRRLLDEAKLMVEMEIEKRD